MSVLRKEIISIGTKGRALDPLHLIEMVMAPVGVVFVRIARCCHKIKVEMQGESEIDYTSWSPIPGPDPFMEDQKYETDSAEDDEEKEDSFEQWFHHSLTKSPISSPRNRTLMILISIKLKST